MGPVATILLRTGLTQGEVEVLDDWLRTLGRVGSDTYPQVWRVTVVQYEALGLRDRPARPPCTTTINRDLLLGMERFRGTDSYDDEALRRSVEQDEEARRAVLGFAVVEEFALSAACNQPIDHRILGALAAHLAERFDGLVYLGAALYQRLPSAAPTGPAEAAWDVAVAAAYRAATRAALRRLPGRLYEVPVTVGWGGEERTRLIDVVDATFLRAWLGHPDFSMIK